MASEKKRTPRLTDAQRSYLKRLHQSGGFAKLYNATFQTAQSLHDKGMVVVTIETPVNGYVQITEDGKRVVEALSKLLAETPKRDIREFLQQTEAQRLK